MYDHGSYHLLDRCRIYATGPANALGRLSRSRRAAAHALKHREQAHESQRLPPNPMTDEPRIMTSTDSHRLPAIESHQEETAGLLWLAGLTRLTVRLVKTRRSRQ